MGKRGTSYLLAIAVVTALASLTLALLEPSLVGAWVIALGMSSLAVAQFSRLRDLKKHDH
jgi:hypothetical protein